MIRNGLKIRWEQSRAGSSPAARTKLCMYKKFVPQRVAGLPFEFDGRQH